MANKSTRRLFDLDVMRVKSKVERSSADEDKLRLKQYTQERV